MKKPKPPETFEEQFDEARKAWPGIKRGLETELKCLQKHKDWRKVIHLLKPAIDEQINRNKQKKALGVFVPPWKNFKTWLNNRCWEEEERVGESKRFADSMEETKRYIEKQKKKTREDSEEWLRSKSTAALLDFKRDKGHLYKSCGWLIDEILEERTKT
jgi:hypothetical protein